MSFACPTLPICPIEILCPKPGCPDANDDSSKCKTRWIPPSRMLKPISVFYTLCKDRLQPVHFTVLISRCPAKNFFKHFQDFFGLLGNESAADWFTPASPWPHRLRAASDLVSLMYRRCHFRKASAKRIYSASLKWLALKWPNLVATCTLKCSLKPLSAFTSSSQYVNG